MLNNEGFNDMGMENIFFLTLIVTEMEIKCRISFRFQISLMVSRFKKKDLFFPSSWK